MDNDAWLPSWITMPGSSQAGAPLMHRTAVELASLQQQLAVTDGLFSMSSSVGQSPGSIRYVNDIDTQLRLLSGEARLMEASGERREASRIRWLVPRGRRGPRGEASLMTSQ